MKKLAVWLSVLGLALVAGSAAASGCSSLASMDWLLGDWFAESSNTTWRETWTPAGPGTWEGRGIESSRADPGKSSSEALRMVEMDDAVFYLAKVRHNELPIAFRLVECGNGRLVFTNPAHDFPRRLDYARQPDGRLQVRVSDGADKGFTLDFARAAVPAADLEAVLAAEDARFAAMIAGDAMAMRRWFADDLLYVHSTGKIEDREQLIESIQSGRLRYDAVEPSGRRVVFSGQDAAFVHGLARIRAASGPAALDFQASYLAIYSRSGEVWRLRAWQSARLP